MTPKMRERSERGNFFKSYLTLYVTFAVVLDEN